MIRVRVERDASGRIRALQVEGHAGYAEYGRDIVCAAVSVLAQTAALGCRERLGLQPRVRQDPGFFSLELEEADRVRAEDLLEIVLLGLRAVARSHPDHVTIRDTAGGTAGEAPLPRRTTRP
ncbi:MAG: ribosomal-processing cysteine protease Prp [Clostridia bacterium]|nr:ribosomal-processing cysteine protease Prp [Clostridia bacterium]